MMMDVDLKRTIMIMIRWLHQKQAELDLHCFQKRRYNFEKEVTHTLCVLC